MNKKICVVSQVFPVAKDDHFASWILFLLNKLHKKGLDFHVVAPHKPGSKVHEKMEEGIEVTRFKYAPEKLETIAYTGAMVEQVKKSFMNKLLFFAFMGSFLLSTLRVARREKPQLMHAHFWVIGGVVAWVASNVLKIPYVVNLHGTDAFLIRKIPALKFLANRVLGRASAIFTVSSALKECIVEETTVNEDKIFVVSMPVHEDIFHFHDRQHIVLEKKINLLSVGRLIDYKGHQHAIKAISLLKDQYDITLKIIGVGPNKDDLLALAAQLGVADNVVIQPPVTPEALFLEYRKTDMILHIPVVDANLVTEGLGMIVLEAFRCGVPVIGSRCGGVPEMVIDGETGILVDEGDAQAIASGIDKYAGDVDFRKKVITNAVKKYDHDFSQKSIINRTMNGYFYRASRKE